MGSVVMAKKIECRERERDQLERKRAEEKLTVITVAVTVLDLIWSRGSTVLSQGSNAVKGRNYNFWP